MSRIWATVLLLSLGLNLGLGFRLLRPGHPLAVPTAEQGDGSGTAPTVVGNEEGPWAGSAPGDTTAWNRYLGRRLDHLVRTLELSPAQVEDFKAAQAGQGRLLRQKRRDLTRERFQLRELLAAAEVDRSAVRQALAEIGRSQAELDSLSAETLLRELEVLDADQRTRYLEQLPTETGRRHGSGRHGRQRRDG